MDNLLQVTHNALSCMVNIFTNITLTQEYKESCMMPVSYWRCADHQDRALCLCIWNALNTLCIALDKGQVGLNAVQKFVAARDVDAQLAQLATAVHFDVEACIRVVIHIN